MTDQWLKVKGKLVYNPPRPGLKKTRNHDEFFLVLELPDNISTYYRYWVRRRFGLNLSPPAYGCHITILDGRNPVKPHLREHWKKYEGKTFDIQYSNNLYQNWKFWCLPVICPELDEIREELGFSNEKRLHITIGRMD